MEAKEQPGSIFTSARRAHVNVPAMWWPLALPPGAVVARSARGREVFAANEAAAAHANEGQVIFYEAHVVIRRREKPRAHLLVG